jgi:hypothetical protein
MTLSIFYSGMMRALARLVALPICAALLSGCNMLGVGYGHIDTYAAWTAADYFDLDAQQKQDFKTRFDRLHEWHRAEQLPNYAKFLASANSRIHKGLAAEDVNWITQGVEERYRSMVRRGSEDAAAVLMTITPAQMESLQKRWSKDNARYAREHRVSGTPAEQRQARTERELKRVKEWVGELSPDQEKKVAALAEELPLAPKLRYEDRLRRQREFVQIMASRGDAKQFPERLRQWLLNWEEGRSPEYQRFFADWRRQQAEFYVNVERVLTPAQKNSVIAKVERYANDFTQLAQR